MAARCRCRELLSTLAEGYRLDTGATATVEITGTPTEPPADVALTLYRTAQEAITNIRKHAPGAVVDIGCAYARKRSDAERPQRCGAGR